MLEKSGESSDTDIEIVGEVIVTTSNETKAQVEVTNKVGNPPTTPTVTVDPRMSDRMPPMSDRASPTAAETQNETQVEVAIPAIGSDKGRTLTIPISSTKTSILRQILTRTTADLGSITNNNQTTNNNKLLGDTDIPPLIRCLKEGHVKVPQASSPSLRTSNGGTSRNH